MDRPSAKYNRDLAIDRMSALDVENPGIDEPPSARLGECELIKKNKFWFTYFHS